MTKPSVHTGFKTKFTNGASSVCFRTLQHFQTGRAVHQMAQKKSRACLYEKSTIINEKCCRGNAFWCASNWIWFPWRQLKSSIVLLHERRVNGKGTDALDDVFDRNIELCTQSTIFIDLLARCALISLRLFRSVSRFISSNLSQRAEEHRRDMKLVNFPFPIPKSLLASKRFSPEDKKNWNYARAKRHRTGTAPTKVKGRKKAMIETQEAYVVFQQPDELTSILSTIEERLTVGMIKIQNNKGKLSVPKLPVLQTVRKHYNLLVSYKIYRLANSSPLFVKSVSSYIARFVKKV